MSDRERLLLEPAAGAPQVGLLIAALEDGRRRTIAVRDEAGRLSDVPPEPMGRALARLARVRTYALAAIGAIDDVELHRVRSLPPYDVTPAWAIHHLVQHEAEHRAHIALIRDLLAES